MRTSHTISLALATALVTAAPALVLADNKSPDFLTPGAALEADPGFAIQGEYSGMIDEQKMAVQVIALPNGEFEGVACTGGLPGDGWDGELPRERSRAKPAEDGSVTFTSESGNTGKIADGKMEIYNAEGEKIGEIPRVERESPTLGQEPPEGAEVLFDGSGMDNWNGGSLTDENNLMVQATSKTTFGDCTIHLEFRIPYKRNALGQGRGNSGVYLQGRYEVQVLDSFGLQGRNNEAGGIYSVSDPSENMCFPPLSWQTYDIDFTAARWNDDGSKAEDARVTVRHNGVVVQDDVAVPRSTTAAPNKESADPGPLYLQGHGNRVVYRNIWIEEKG